MSPSRLPREPGPESQVFAGRCKLAAAERWEATIERTGGLTSSRLREVLDWLNAEFDAWSSADTDDPGSTDPE